MVSQTLGLFAHRNIQHVQVRDSQREHDEFKMNMIHSSHVHMYILKI